MNYMTEILTKAKSLIEKPENWYKGAYTNPANVNCMCGLGAIIRAIDPDATDYLDIEETPLEPVFKRAHSYLTEVAKPKTFHLFNDNPKTKHEDVMKMFDKAIEAANADQD